MTEESNNNYVVYCHTCPNGMMYFGVTRNIKSRWRVGCYRNGTQFKDAIIEFGWKSIKHEILYNNLTRDEALKIEDELIVKARGNGTCLNMFRSGHYHQTDEFKEEKKARGKARYESKKEEIKAQCKAYRDTHKEQLKDSRRERYKRKKGGGDKPEPLF